MSFKITPFFGILDLIIFNFPYFSLNTKNLFTMEAKHKGIGMFSFSLKSTYSFFWLSYNYIVPWFSLFINKKSHNGV